MRARPRTDRRLRRTLARGAAAALVAAGVPGALPAIASQDQLPRLEARDCGVVPPGLDFTVTCSWLVVPESRDRERSSSIRLAVMVLHSRSAEPVPDPVVFLAGGPGDSAIANFERFQSNPMLATRDVILFDQRGAGQSEPSLDCPEREQAVLTDFGRAAPHRRELAAVRKATAACRERLEEEGIDLDAYDTEANAADLADLRVALGVDEWNLNGVSYGTRLALETMRSHPEGIRSVVLDSVYPPSRAGLGSYEIVDDAFERLFAACDDDPGCAQEHPELATRFEEMVDRYNESPAAVTLADGTQLEVTGDDLVGGMFNALYDRELIPLLPDAIASLGGGDTSLVASLAEDGLLTLSGSSEGMFLSMECADLAKFATRTRAADVIESPGTKSVLVRYDAVPYCDLWDVEPLPARFNRTVRSAIPALVLAGQLDPITPADDSRKAAAALRNSVYVEFEGYGHAVTTTDCSRSVRQQFLDDPGGPLDLACVEALTLDFA